MTTASLRDESAGGEQRSGSAVVHGPAQGGGAPNRERDETRDGESRSGHQGQGNGNGNGTHQNDNKANNEQQQHMSLSDPGSDDTTDFYSASDTDTESSTDSEEDRRISTELHRQVFFSAVGEEEGYELTSTSAKKKSKRKGRKGRTGRRGGKSKFPDLDDDDLAGLDTVEDSGRRRRRQRRQRQRGPSVSTAASGKSFRKLRYTPDEERAVVRKFDRKLVLFVALLYMLSFLDRSNIGNARIAGMDEDLQSTPPKDDWYEWALTAFYIAYICFEWMSILWRLIPAHIYVSVIVLSWGLTASLQAVAVSYPMLIFLRTMLGIGEAAFTGVPFYLSFFYKRHELALRTAIFISAAPLATSFASFLAWAILKLGSISPIRPWRLLFLVEGFPSVFVAVLAWHIIPDSPQTASYLTRREKKVAALRLLPSSSSQSSSSSGGLKTHDILTTLLSPTAWLTSLIFFLTNLSYSSLPVFLPTILTSMGHSPLMSQALSAPPYLCSFVIVLATASLSDRYHNRSAPLIFHALLSASGYSILAFSQPLGLEPGSWIRYLAVYPAAIGFFNVVVLTIAWSINNQRTEGGKGAGFALMQVVGQCGPLVGTRLYPKVEGPYWGRGMGVCAAAMVGVALLAVALRTYLVWSNGKLDKEVGYEAVGGGYGDGDEEEGLVGGGGDDGRRGRAGQEKFRYML
ncbi:MFS transporter [Pseudoneurospora amorphoporcata]|uniref:MFS transporter n=1 Tax=Pseudoneurospora amorphoporcata TaxID=241081 RepID=A0AAN6P0K2_9PEZI|nr:MFS transporter [Pseudoneurospora amorphoporcata]